MKYSTRFIMIFLMLILCSDAEWVFGQNLIVDHSMNSYKMPTDVQAYLKNKYENQIEYVDSNTFRETPEGPRGYLQIKGHIVPKNRNNITGKIDNRPISIAHAFLKEEAGLFGIADITEWRPTEPSYPSTDGTTLISYVRYIHDAQDFSEIQLIIAADYSIRWIYAMLVPVTSDMYKAFSNQMISEKEATKIIEHQLKTEGISFSEIAVSKRLIDIPPYVIWESNGYLHRNRVLSWFYKVNAFTGEVVTKYIGPYE